MGVNDREKAKLEQEIADLRKKQAKAVEVDKTLDAALTKMREEVKGYDDKYDEQVKRKREALEKKKFNSTWDPKLTEALEIVRKPLQSYGENCEKAVAKLLKAIEKGLVSGASEQKISKCVGAALGVLSDAENCTISFYQISKTLKYQPTYEGRSTKKSLEKIQKDISSGAGSIESQIKVREEKIRRIEKADKYGVALDKLDTHESYLTAVKNYEKATTGDQLRASAKELKALGNYLNSNILYIECDKKVKAIEEVEKAEKAVTNAKKGLSDAEKALKTYESEVLSTEAELKKAQTELLTIEAGIDGEKAAVESEYDRNCSDNDTLVMRLKGELSSLESQKNEAELTLGKTFFLAFGKKKELTALVESLGNQIVAKKNEIEQTAQQKNGYLSTKNSKLSSIDDKLSAARKKVQDISAKLESVKAQAEKERTNISAYQASLEKATQSYDAVIAKQRHEEEELKAEEERRRQDEIEAQRKAEEARRQAEIEAQRKAEEVRRQAEIEAQRRSDEARQQAESEALRRAEEQREKEELARIKREELGAKRAAYIEEQKAEEEQRRKAIEEAKIREEEERKAALRDRRDKERMAQATAELEEKFKVGAIVQFGKYPQGKNGEEAPIEWIVLERKGNGVKLLSLKGLTTAPYNNETGATYWHECSLRNWLNGSFLDKAFTSEEADSILLSEIKAIKSPKYDTAPGKDTKDKVFLLNYDEAEALSSKVSTMYLTEWAVKNDAFFSMHGYGASNYAYWWLRSPGSSPSRSTIMGQYISGKDASSKEGVGVRPALWLNLNSDFFYGDFEELVVDAMPDVSIPEMIEILKGKYQFGNKPSTIAELEADNEEYSEQLRTLKYKCGEEYGMTYGEFLKYNGLLIDKAEERESYDPTEMITALQLKYTEASEKLKTLEELILDNPEYEQELNLFSRIANEVVGSSAVRFLKDAGVLYRAEVDGVILKQQQAQEKADEKAEARARALAERQSKKVDKLPIRDPKLSQRIIEYINKLEAFFPEHQVFALDSIDKKLRENLSAIYKSIGYDSVDDMLIAYGFYKISGDEVRELRPTVLYTPGNEPAIVKSKVESIVRLLNEYYPSKIIERSLQVDHKSLASSVSGMYQWLGYENAGLFLQAYGFTYKVLDGDGTTKVGRTKSVFEDEIVEELKKRAGNTPYPGMKELKEANPDLLGKLKTLANKSNETFGMPLAMYFKTQGIIAAARERTESSSATSQVTEKKIKKPSTVSRTAVGALADRVDRGLYSGATVDELKEAMEGLTVKYTVNTDTISVNGSLRSEDDVEIPLGIDAIAKNAFQGRKDIVRVVLSESVVSVEKRAFEACDNLEEIVVTNPKCVFHPEALALCNHIRIVVDRTSVIEEFMATVAKGYEADYLDRIKTLEKCIQNAGGIPNTYWAGEDWKLAFSIDDVVYQTEITAIGDDYSELDEIIEKVFMGSRVTGTLDYFKDPVSGSNSISRTVCCDSTGNII